MKTVFYIYGTFYVCMYLTGSGRGALLLGNAEGSRELEVLLPNGRFCGNGDHGVPDFSFNGVDIAENGGVTEADGVVYTCAGKTVPGGAETGEQSSNLIE